MSDFQRDQPVTVQLLSPQWDLVLHCMAKQPYEVVASLIGEIQRQRQMHDMQQRRPFPPPRQVSDPEMPQAGE